MCCIFGCFGWALDFLQRLITFGLACILCCAVCFGLTVAIIAGIAYGYNYSMAEFMTFTRSDVTVFMRRGQFYDSPDVGKSRRSGAEDMFSTNTSTDYEDHKISVESKPLAESWSKTQDTRKYADFLTRFNPGRKMNVQQSEAQQPDHVREQPSLPKKQHSLPRKQSSLPRKQPAPVKLPTQVRGQPTQATFQAPPKTSNHRKVTVSGRSGSSEIVMRDFKPMPYYVTTNKHPGMPDTLFPTRSTRPQSIPLFNPKDQSKSYEDGQIKDYDENFVPMRVWRTTVQPPVIPDDPEDIDEENIVYKPV